MSARKPSWRITALIETHNLIAPYAECQGCSICSVIEEISKETGLWMNEKPKRYNKRTNLTPKSLEEMLDAGIMKKDICEMTGLSKNALSNLIKRWLPDRHVKRNKYNPTLNFQEYQQLLNKGIKREEIARRQGMSVHALDYYVKKWREEDENECVSANR